MDLSIEDGDMVAIVGPSGSGKSTIMNMITPLGGHTGALQAMPGQYETRVVACFDHALLSR